MPLFACCKLQMPTWLLAMMKYAEQIGDSGKQLLSSRCDFESTPEKRFDYISLTSSEKQLSLSSVCESFESLTRTRSTPKHKTSHLKFLVWVAYLRNSFPLIDEIQRRTCPLIGCEICFETQQAMLEHIYSCPALSKGRYRCPECGKEEPISRNHINGCQDSNTCKDWLANSFKCVKRRLSRRGPNKSWDCDSSVQSPVSPLGIKDSQYDPLASCELFSESIDCDIKGNGSGDVRCQDLRQELDSSTVLELGDTSTRVELACTKYQPYYVRDDNQTRLCGISPSGIQPQEKGSPRTAMAIAELDAWSGKDPVHACLTSSGSSGLSHHEQMTPNLVESLPTHHYSYLELRRSPGPRDLPALEVFSTLDNHVIASESFLSPLSAFTNQQRYFNVYQSSPTDSRASTSMPSMTRSPTDSVSSASSPLNDFMPRTSFSSDRVKASVWSEFFYVDCKSAMNYEDDKIFENLTSQQDLSGGGLSQIDFGDESRKDPIDVASWISESGASLTNEKSCDQHVQMPYYGAQIHNESSSASALSSSARSCRSISKAATKCGCGYAPRGLERNKRQNLKRHQATCKVSSPTAFMEKPYICSFQNCGRAFTRPDNLLVHQRAQGHLGDVELELDSEAMHDIFNTPTLKRHRIT